MKLGRMKVDSMTLGSMKLGRNLAIGLLAVTGLVSGAWAQTDDYPKEPPNAQPPSMQGPGGQPGPVMQQQYPGGPNGPGANGTGANGPNSDGPGPNGEGPNGEQQKSDGPAPDVARLSLVYGDVSTQRGDTGEWAVTTVNAPVMRGDQVATGEKSRTEIQLDFADLLRLAARSQVKIADLSRKRIQVQVAQGYTSYSVMKGGEADVEIDSPNAAVHPLKVGRYRVQVNSDAETDVIVREGEAEITTPQGSTRVREGEMITIRGTDNPEYKISKAPEKDDWDKWNRDRDSVIEDADGPRRTNRYYTGAADLDGYGHWVYVPGYGNVWQPYQQSATWAPYQNGRWVWEPFYGWTWVSYDAWGWAPYHYGRWFFYENSWCWWPGPVYSGYRPLWSPAFVFFVGFGPRVGFGFGSIGWFPVGPHDVFYPWYGRGFNRVNVVSIASVNVVGRGGFIAPLAVRGRQPFFSNANLVLTNPRVRGSVTSVSTAEFGHGGNIGLRRGVEESELRESHVMTGNVPVVPTHESLSAGRTNVAGPAGAQTRTSGRFFTQHQPPAGPESFHDQAARVQRVVGSESNAQGTRGEAITRQEGSANAGATAHTGGSESSRTGAATRSESGSSDNANHGGGWSHFGTPGNRANTEIGRTDTAPRTESGPRTDSQSSRSGESSGSKPPLELHRPIVTQRQTDTRSSESAPSSRTSESQGTQGHSQPRYSPPPRSSGPAPRSSSGSSSRSSGSSSHSESKSSGSKH